MKSMMKSGLLALVIGVAIVAASGCSDDLGCSLNGVCQDGACVCAAPWDGPACDVLQILPSPVGGAAIYGVAPNVTSWGGNVVRWSDGKYHLFVAEMAEGCGMVEWHSNSFVAHAVSDTVDGPYAKADVAVQSWAHNPQALYFGGELFVFHIGPGDGAAQRVNCSQQHRVPAATSHWAPPTRDELTPAPSPWPRPAQLTYIHAAPGPDGP